MIQKTQSNIIPFPKQSKELGIASITKIDNGIPIKVLLDNHISSIDVVGVFCSDISWCLYDKVKVLVNHNRAVVYENLALFKNTLTDKIVLVDQDIHFKFLDTVKIISGNTVIKINRNGEVNIDAHTLCNTGLWCLSVMGYQFSVNRI